MVLTEANSKLIQKELSEAIDKASIKSVIDSSDFLQKAHFNSESAPRAGTWLNAIPSESSGNKVQGIGRSATTGTTPICWGLTNLFGG